ncbi:MAG: hypothetical protein CBD58_04850 [bacterium TMED198]|nr:MAG: hypothetical protein CBD58_04850 [bacterium TMED198]
MFFFNDSMILIYIIMIKLALYIFLFKFSFIQSGNYLLVVSFDGFRHDYLDKVETPAFDKLIDRGSFSNDVKTVFPSLTFPSHYSIATGSYPDKHKILGNKFYNKDIEKYYNYRDKESVQNGDFYGSEPIWVTAERQGVLSATFFWIGSEAMINGYRPSTYKKYDPSYSFRSRVDSVSNWFKKPFKDRPRLVMLYFNEPDYTGHKYGPDSKETNQSIKESDEILNYLVKSLNNLPIKDSINIIVLSDHGMANSGSEKLILLNDYIDTSPFQFWMKGSVLSIDNKNHNKTINQKTINQLIKIPNLSVYTSETLPQSYNFYNSSFPGALLVAGEGYYISPDSRTYDAKGMHGYDPDLKSMKTIFIASGPNIKQNYKLDGFESIHIYPLFCKLLQIQPNTNIDGGSDGRLEVLEKILKN